MNRRDVLTASALMPASLTTPAAGLIGGQRTNRNIEPDLSWRISEGFFFQKSIRSGGNGVPLERFPFETVQRLLCSGIPEAYDQITELFRRYVAYPVDPAAGLVALPDYAYESVRNMPSPPAEDSKELRENVSELYWCELLRDTDFSVFETNEIAVRAAEDLANPRTTKVTDGAQAPALFSSRFGGQSGFFLSALLLAPIPLWPLRRHQQYPSFLEGENFGTTEEEWKRIQSAEIFPAKLNQLRAKADYVRNGRRLASLVYLDYPTQIFDAAVLQISQFRTSVFRRRGHWGMHERNTPFIFGGPADLLSHIAACCKISLGATWLAKWGRFYYPRPEEVCAWAQSPKTSASLTKLRERLQVGPWGFGLGPRLLSSCYPDGAPVHPSYPAGHSAIAGAAATIIKAFLRPDAEVPSGFVDWRSMGINLHDRPLQLTDEIDKLSWNISIGRCFAGVHYRFDCEAGLALGEDLALGYLRNIKKTYPIDIVFTIKKFNGEFVSI